MASVRFWAAVRVNKRNMREWLDRDTISSLAESSREQAEAENTKRPRYYKVNPVVRITQFDCVEVKQGSAARPPRTGGRPCQT